MISVKIKKLDPNLPTPAYAHEGNAAFDLFAREKMALAPGEKAIIPSGIQVEIPKGYVGLIWDKSSVGIKAGIKNLGGVIDSSYRGEIMIGMVNLSSDTYVFEKGNKVAQMLIQKVEEVKIEILGEADALTDTTRGSGHFGSTGK